MFPAIIIEMNATSVFLLLVIIVISAWYYGLFSRRNSPPGPWGYPIVGHMPLLGAQPHETFMKLREKYGDVFSIRMGGFPTIVVNGKTAITETLVKYRGTFDDRPKFFTFIMSPRDRVAFAHYSERWKLFKKIVVNSLHEFMNDKHKSLDALLNEESVCFVNDILAHHEQPFDPRDDLYVSACSAAYQLCFGKGEDIRMDEDFKSYLREERNFISFVRPDNPIEIMPWLRYVMPWKLKPMMELGKLVYTIIGKQIADHKATFIADSPRDITDAFLNLGNETAEMRRLDIKGEQLFGVLTELIPAAFDTTATALLWLCLLMVKHPDIQEKVQDELDSVIGDVRISVASDRSKLPYTEATIMESMRLKLPIPTSLPHAAYTDTKFRGFDIQKGTVVMINLHSVTRDSDMFAQPDEFHPEHFLNSDGSLNKEKSNFILPFGLGQRKCLGESLARTQLFVIFGSLLQRFTLCAVDGEAYSMEGVNGLSNSPRPYRIIAKRR